jgi:outer membrane protein
LRFVMPGSALFFCMMAAAAIAGPTDDSQATPSKPLGLAQALNYAQTNYPSVQAALEEKVAAGKETDVAKTAYLPQETLLVQINRSTINNITGLLLPQATIPSISGPVSPQTGQSAWNSGAGVLVTWQPFDFGYRAAAVDAARQAESVASQTVSLTELQVMNATGNAYMNLAAAQSLVAVAHANVERLHTFSAATHVLVSNKLRPGVEAEQADAAEALAETTLLSALSNVDSQRATLAKLVAQPAQDVAIDSRPILESPPAALSILVSSRIIRRQSKRLRESRSKARSSARSRNPMLRNSTSSVAPRRAGADGARRAPRLAGA